jgi:hypothetical protein
MAYLQDQTHTTADFSRVTSPSSSFERRVCYQRQAGGYRRIETTIEVVETVIPFDTTDDDHNQLVEDPIDNIDATIEDLRATVQNLNQLLVELREAVEGIHQLLLEHNTRMEAYLWELRESHQTPQDENNDHPNNNIPDSNQRVDDSNPETDSSSEESVYLWYTFSSAASDDSWSSSVSEGSEDSYGSSDDSEDDSSSSGSDSR